MKLRRRVSSAGYTIQTDRKTRAGARNPAVTAWLRQRLGPSSPGLRRAGEPVVTPASGIYFPYAFVAAASSFEAMPSTSFGFFRKSWSSDHSVPPPPPNSDGARSDMSNRKRDAFASAVAVARDSASGYALALTSLFGEEKPPNFAQIVAACGVSRYLISARTAGVSL